MRRILYVNFDFPPISGPGVWRALGFAKYLPTYGVLPTILASKRPSSRRLEDTSLLGGVPPEVEVVRVDSLLYRDVRDAMDRWPKAGPLVRLRSQIDRLYPDQVLPFALKIAARGLALAKTRRFDLIFTSGPPHITHLAGHVIKAATGLPHVMDYRDLWSDDAVQIRKGPYQLAMHERLEAQALASADAVVCVSDAYVEHLSARWSPLIERDRFVRIRNAHDIPDALVALGLEPPKNERLHIHFSGTPQMNVPVGVVFDAVARVKAKEPRRAPRLTFTGLPEPTRAELRARGLEGVVEDVGFMPHEASVRAALAADVMLALVKSDQPGYAGTIPGKVYEALALGRHLWGVLPANTEVKALLPSDAAGTLSNVADLEDVGRGLRRLMDRFAAGTLNPPRARAAQLALAEAHSRRARAAELAIAIEGILQRPVRKPRVFI